MTIKKLTEALSESFPDVIVNSVEGHTVVSFSTYTAGQTVIVEIEHKTVEEFVERFKRRAEEYNVDDAAAVFISVRGQIGIPNDIQTILDDCREVKDALVDISNIFCEELEKDDDERKPVVQIIYIKED